ncbi:MAG: tRNA dihydrouridine synthase DusB [Hellea sp.]|nr:tRNA dihydrouridine synthase DusB [Hellea sp.]
MKSNISIGNYKLTSRVLAAPMSGVTDLPFRKVLQKFGPGLVVSEMVASETLLKGDEETEARAAGKGDIDPLVIQLVGREPEWMAHGAQMAQNAGADIIDINMGCPARKVTTGLSGSALMKDPDRAADIIYAVISGTSKPVTLKMRLGWDDNMLNAPEIANIAQGAGVELLVVHGRTRCQFYKGHADWGAVAETKKSVSIPVFVNGDIKNAADAHNAMSSSNCDGVMLGRSLVGRPWSILEARARIDGVKIAELSNSEKCRIAIDHYNETIAFYGEQKGLRIARKHLAGYVEHGPFDGNKDRLKSEICQSINPAMVMDLLARAFNISCAEHAA